MILVRPIGIDLGTTNSAVAMLDPNERDLVLRRDSQGRPTTPSCVWSDPASGEVVVGHLAYARRGAAPEPVTSIKRAMGTRITVPLGEAERSPSEISAHILAELRRQMEEELAGRGPAGLSYDVRRAIVTVPAYFDLPAIEATREAARLAGLHVIELLHEPTAAAIYYGWKHDLGDGVYLVYDLGGGTFDVSILRRTAGDFLVLGISGDNFLGGDELDRRLAEHLRRLLVADGYELDLDIAGDEEDRLRFTRLTTVAETAKKALSEQEEVLVQSAGTIRDKAGVPVTIETVVTRSTFETLVDDLLARTVACVEQALAAAHRKAGVDLADVDHILLVGGSTYVPAVAERVKQAFCRNGGSDESRAKCDNPIRDEPETAVALGAALRAAAAGLGVGDDDGDVLLWFRGAGATARGHTTITGQVETSGDEERLVGGRLALADRGQGGIGEVELKEGLRFAFPGVTLRPEAVNDFEFSLWDRDGRLVTSVGRSIEHAADTRQAVGAGLSTAVLPKPIVLEGTDGDRLVRTVLLPEGTTLPTVARFTFAVSDAAGHVRLPIYQASRIIKELRADVGPVALGTPVDVQISCDEQVNIAVRCAVGDETFGGSIEPPPPDDVPSAFDIEEIDRSFEAALAGLGSELAVAQQLRATYDEARSDVDEARRAADHPKLIQRVATLGGLVREARLAQPLEPPLAVVEESVAACLDLLPEATSAKPDLSVETLTAALEEILARAKAAYEARARQTYDEALQAVFSLRQFLTAVCRVQAAETTDVDLAVQAAMEVDQLRQLLLLLVFQAHISGQEELLVQLEGPLREVDELADGVEADPLDTIHRCRVHMTELRRILQQLSPDEAIGADLEGLVKLGEYADLADQGALSRSLDR